MDSLDCEESCSAVYSILQLACVLGNLMRVSVPGEDGAVQSRRLREGAALALHRSVGPHVAQELCPMAAHAQMEPVKTAKAHFIQPYAKQTTLAGPG